MAKEKLNNSVFNLSTTYGITNQLEPTQVMKTSSRQQMYAIKCATFFPCASLQIMSLLIYTPRVFPTSKKHN